MFTNDELKVISDDIASHIRNEMFPPDWAGQIPSEVAQLWVINIIKFGLLWYLSLECFPEKFSIEQLKALQFAVGSLIESKVSEIREELLRRN